MGRGGGGEGSPGGPLRCPLRGGGEPQVRQARARLCACTISNPRPPARTPPPSHPPHKHTTRRLYPLSQRDLPLERKQLDFGPLLPAATRVDNPSRDYSPPNLITLLLTDLGVLTPAAVSDELIQLYT